VGNDVVVDLGDAKQLLTGALGLLGGLGHVGFPSRYSMTV
jgi:hypothetical protein